MSKCFSYISLYFKVLQHRWFTKKNWKNFGIHIINAQETNYGDLFFAVKKIVHNKIEQINNGYSSCQYIPYLSQCNPGVVFFKMGFWVRFNLKKPSKSGLFKKKVGFYSRKTPIQEWGCIGVDTVCTDNCCNHCLFVQFYCALFSSLRKINRSCKLYGSLNFDNKKIRNPPCRSETTDLEKGLNWHLSFRNVAVRW